MTDTTAELDQHLDGLTPLQRRFVEFALDCGSAVEAYRLAGGKASSDESAFTQASRLMRNGQVSAALTAMKYERSRLLVADSAWIREKLVLLIGRAMQAVPVLDSNGEETGVWKCDLTAANAALRTLVLLQEKDPPPKDDQATYEAAMARLRMRGIDVSKARPLPPGN
jgi:phage terminase small subunit